MPARISGKKGKCWIEADDTGRVFLVRVTGEYPEHGVMPTESDELSDNELLALEQLLKMADLFKKDNDECEDESMVDTSSDPTGIINHGDRVGDNTERNQIERGNQ